jgi:hypothetical protein
MSRAKVFRDALQLAEPSGTIKANLGRDPAHPLSIRWLVDSAQSAAGAAAAVAAVAGETLQGDNVPIDLRAEDYPENQEVVCTGLRDFVVTVTYGKPHAAT